MKTQHVDLHVHIHAHRHAHIPVRTHTRLGKDNMKYFLGMFLPNKRI